MANEDWQTAETRDDIIHTKKCEACLCNSCANSASICGKCITCSGETITICSLTTSPPLPQDLIEDLTDPYITPQEDPPTEESPIEEIAEDDYTEEPIPEEDVPIMEEA